MHDMAFSYEFPIQNVIHIHDHIEFKHLCAAVTGNPRMAPDYIIIHCEKQAPRWLHLLDHPSSPFITHWKEQDIHVTLKIDIDSGFPDIGRFNTLLALLPLQHAEESQHTQALQRAQLHHCAQSLQRAQVIRSAQVLEHVQVLKNISYLELSNHRFEAFQDLAQLLWEFPRLTKLTCNKLTWNSALPFLPRASERLQWSWLETVTATGCPDAEHFVWLAQLTGLVRLDIALRDYEGGTIDSEDEGADEEDTIEVNATLESNDAWILPELVLRSRDAKEFNSDDTYTEFRRIMPDGSEKDNRPEQGWTTGAVPDDKPIHRIVCGDFWIEMCKDRELGLAQDHSLTLRVRHLVVEITRVSDALGQPWDAIDRVASKFTDLQSFSLVFSPGQADESERSVFSRVSLELCPEPSSFTSIQKECEGHFVAYSQYIVTQMPLLYNAGKLRFWAVGGSQEERELGTTWYPLRIGLYDKAYKGEIPPWGDNDHLSEEEEEDMEF